MKLILIVAVVSSIVILSPNPNFATQINYFYVEIECHDGTTPICSLQNCSPFDALSGGTIGFYNCDRSSDNWDCDAELTSPDEADTISGRFTWAETEGSFTLGQGNGKFNTVNVVGVVESSIRSTYFLEGTYTVGQSNKLLTHIPGDAKSIVWIQPHGNLNFGGGNTGFHDGIDFGATAGGKFFSAGNGEVTNVEWNTGKGYPGTNYRVTIRIGGILSLDYHFEIGGYAPLKRRQANLLVSVGDKVTAGQHIGNLISGNQLKPGETAHVHFGIYNGHQKICPKNYFTPLAARRFEALYDSGIEKRPAYRVNLCN